MPNQAHHDQQIVDNVPIVHALVREVAARVPASVDRVDLTSAGLVALVAAARAYDPERGVPFAAYARTRIRGALVDELRSQDWASRSVRRTAREIDEVRTRMTNALGQVPDASAVAAAMGVDVSVVRRSTEDLARAMVLSLDAEYGVDHAASLRTSEAGPEEAYERQEQVAFVADAVSELPERLRAVVQGYFIDERPMAELAAELGVSESRISQMRAEALVLLRSALNDAFDASIEVSATKADSVVARRRATYVAAVAERHAARRVPYQGPAVGRPA